MQRLEELMQWQRLQQKKLLRHQQEQKELMTLEQKRLFKEIGLVFDQGKSPLELPEDNIKEASDINVHLLNDEVAFRPQVISSFDDTPVKPVTKSFSELLQEKLKADRTVNKSAMEKPKKKFLKKGEGLARFRMKADKKPLLSQKLSQKPNTQPSEIIQKNKPDVPSGVSYRGLVLNTEHDNKSTISNTTSERQQGNNGAVWPQVVPKPNKVISKHLSSPRHLLLSELNDSKQEQDELCLFELLEQQAANSSFCSTSSVVGKLLGIQTPTKVLCSTNSDGNPSQSIAPHCDTSMKFSRNAYSQSEIVADTGKNIQDNNTTCPPLDNLNLDPLAYHMSKYSQSELLHNEKRSGHSELSLQATSVNKKLSFDSEYYVRQRLFPRNVNINVCDSYETKSSDESSNPKNFCEKMLTSNNHVLQSNGIHKNNSTSPGHASECIARPADEESSHVNDVFRDSQAWSDCSCSSCEESDSGNEHKSLPECQLKPLDTAKVCSVNNDKTVKIDKEESVSVQQEAITFKSALLKERLTELENEIDIFKKENANLRKLRKQYESDVANFNREKKEYDHILKEQTEKMQENLLAERRKLAKDKQVFEKYCKGIKSQPNRQEREEILALKQQVAEMQEELIRKDSRWSATQVRTRDRMRQLNKQISQLKEENEKLKAEKAQIKKVRFLNPKGKMVSNTKVIHSVNEKLGYLKLEDVENPIVIKNVIPRKRIPARVLSQNASRKDIKKSTKNIYTVPDLQGKLENTNVNIDQQKCIGELLDDHLSGDDSSENQVHNHIHGDHNVENVDLCDVKKHKNSESEDIPMVETLVYDSFFQNFGNVYSEQIIKRNGKTDEETSSPEPTGLSGDKPVTYTSTHDVINNHSLNENISTNLEISSVCVPKTDCIIKPALEKNTSHTIFGGSSVKENFTEIMHADGTREKNFFDGRQEIWYTNGNVKKQSSDKSVTKMIYYNGDVKEKHHMEGIEKYYYAETKTWQTTYSDGREILEFPNGQIENKMPNGTSAISYPNGCTLMKHTDGSEEWTLSDGTVVKKSILGTKELVFPNGQKEIHTENHKRREYPDGTVKYIYPDGTQETRYSTGRIRLKDKSGKLVMDSVA